MRHNVDMLDRSIRHEEAMFKIQVSAIADGAIERLLYEADVFRMNPLEYKVDRWLNPWVVSRNSIRFLCPDGFSGSRTPAEAAGVAESLRFSQISFAAL